MDGRVGICQVCVYLWICKNRIWEGSWHSEDHINFYVESNELRESEDGDCWQNSERQKHLILHENKSEGKYEI